MSENTDKLIKIDPYSLSPEEKNSIFMKCISESIKFHFENCIDYQNYCKKKNFDTSNIIDLSSIPYLPVDIFKKMTLLSVPKSEIIKILKSSATTSNLPSIIHLDKKTATRQMISLNSIIRNFLGEEKMNFIILDNKESLESNDGNLSSRGSAIRGMLIYAKKFTCILNENLKIESEILSKLKNDKESKTCIFGFTWVIHKL